MSEEPITIEWIEQQGFAKSMLGTYAKKVSDGPDDSACNIVVGCTPWNGMGTMVYVGEFGILTNVASRDDLLTLVRLLEGGRIDHPYVEDVDFGDDDDDE